MAAVMPVDVSLDLSERHAHRLHVTVHAPATGPRQRIQLPVWIPGSYLVREFAQHMHPPQAWQQQRRLSVNAVGKDSWEARTQGSAPITWRYTLYAHDASVRTAMVDTSRVFINPAATVVQVLGHRGGYRLRVARQGLPANWRVVTGLEPQRTDARGYGTYLAADYDELVDQPLTVAPGWLGQFQYRGVPHQLFVTGAPSHADLRRLLHDTERVVQAHVDFWHPNGEAPPFARYVFMLHTSAEGYGGLEHRNNTALLAPRADLPRRGPHGLQPGPVLRANDGYTRLLGLISHEYFHAWNVKRLRPLARYHYQRENHTSLLWFFEGFTSYYDDLMLVRAGCLGTAAYLQLLARTVNQVAQTPGQHVQSLAQASHDAWTKYYRMGENTPNITVSYYTKGALVALCLDAALRQAGRSLDHLMQALWQRIGDGVLREADLYGVLRAWGLNALARQLQQWVHVAEPLPVSTALHTLGVEVFNDEAPLGARLGLRTEPAAGGLRVTHVMRGGAAEAAGFAPGDLWLAQRQGAQWWQIQQLDDAARFVDRSQRWRCMVARDGQIMTLQGRWPATTHVVRLQRRASLQPSA